MRIMKRLLTFILAICFVVSLFLLNPTEVNAQYYADGDEKIVARFDNSVKELYSDSLIGKNYNNKPIFGRILGNTEQNIAIANAKIEFYQEQIDSGVWDNDLITYNHINDKLEEEKANLEKYQKKQKVNETVSKMTKTYAKAINLAFDEVINALQDTDHVDYGGMTFRIGMTIVSCWLDQWHLGGLVDSFTNFLNSGTLVQSEQDRLLEALDERIEGLHKDMELIEKQINDLSNKLSEKTEEIISRLSNAIEASAAKQRILEFSSASVGNFSYESLKNSVFGSTSGVENPYGFSTAYASKLNELIYKNASPDKVKKAFDDLFESLYTSSNMFYNDYLIEKEGLYTKSIAREFYSYVSANRDLIQKGSPETIAVDYLFDLYNTAITVDQEMLRCFNYQIYTMKLENGINLKDDDVYVYNGKEITYRDMLNQMDAIFVREEQLERQVAKDLAYILNAKGSYYREIPNEGIQYYTDDNTETFGKLMTNDVVYLNELGDVCYLFGLDSTLVQYKWYAGGKDVTINPYSSFFEVNNLGADTKTLKAVVYYGDERTVLYTVDFVIDSDDEGFAGGTGTFEDPYLISDAKQMFNINSEENLGKYYKLIKDISFKGTRYTPIGTEDNPFNGVFDGNGYKISNVGCLVTNSNVAGLFGYLSNNAIVKNVKIVDSYFSVDTKSFEKVFVGAIAGYSAGLIYNCDIEKTAISATLKNEPDCNSTINKNVYVYAGGVVGISVSSVRTLSDFDESSCAASDFFKKLGSYSDASNETGNVYYCTFNNGNISAYSSRDYSGNSDAANQSFVYSGGIAGYLSKGAQLGYCASRTDGVAFNITAGISSSAKKLGTSYIYAKAYSGGIAGMAADGSKLFGVYSGFDADSEENCSKYITSSTDPYNYGAAYVLWFDLSLNKRECKAYAKKYNSGKEAINKISNYNSIRKPDAYFKSYNSDYYFTGDVIELFVKDYKEGQYIANYNYPLAFEELVFRINNVDYYSELKGQINSYIVLGYHYIDNYSEFDYSRINKTRVMIVFSVVIDGNTVIMSKEVEMVSLKAYIESISILRFPSKTTFEVNSEYIFDGALAINYSNGYTEVVDFDEHNNLLMEQDFLFNDDYLERYSIGSVGFKTIIIKYGEFKTRYCINVVCHHLNISEEYREVFATCSHGGFKYKYCKDCHKYVEIIDEVPETEHARFELLNDKPATCCEEGYKGDRHCADCGCLIEEGSIIPKEAHQFVDYDEHTHECSECHKRYEHHYVAIEQETSILYKCIECGHHIETPKTRSELESAPKIVVSDGYALGENNEVVIYVSIINNPGITGASFSIVFDENLKYVDYEAGNLLTNPICVVNDDDAESHIISMTVASDSPSYKSGTLIKLIFKTPETIKEGNNENDVRIGDTFGINVTYSNSKKSMLSGPTNKAFDVLTFGGTISIVNHLPGDVDGNSVVDLIDAIEIARYLSMQNQSLATQYSDLNLDGGTNIDDLTRLLQYLVGGYDAPVQSNHYYITLKYNNSEKEDTSFAMDYYVKDEDGNYQINKMHDLPEAEAMRKEGYKFDGWYTEFVGGTKIENYNEEGNEGSYLAYYDADKYKQTLYAHYTQNKIILVVNGKEYEYIYNKDGNNLISLEDLTAQFEKNITITYYYEGANSSKLLGKFEEVIRINKWISDEGKDVSTTSTYDLANGETGTIILYPEWKYIEPLTEGAEFDLMNAKVADETNNDGEIKGWRLSPGGTEITGYITDSIILFAFVANIKYELTFVINLEGKDITYNDHITRETGTFSELPNANDVFNDHEGYEADYWVDADGNCFYWGIEDGIDKLVKDNTLYAHWNELNWTVIYHYTTSVNKTLEKTVKYGERVQQPSASEFNLGDYKITGWYSDKNHTTNYVFGSVVDSKKIVDVYVGLIQYHTGYGSKAISSGVQYGVVCDGEIDGKITIKIYFYRPGGGGTEYLDSFTVNSGQAFSTSKTAPSGCTLYCSYSYGYYGSKTISAALGERKLMRKTGSISAGTYIAHFSDNVDGPVDMTRKFSVPNVGSTQTGLNNLYDEKEFSVTYDSTYECTISYFDTGSTPSVTWTRK